MQSEPGRRTKRCLDWTKLILSAWLPLVLGIFTIVYTVQQYDISKQNREQDLAIANANREQDLAIANANREQDLNISNANREQDRDIAEAIRIQDQQQVDELRIQTIYDKYINDISALVLNMKSNVSHENLLIQIRAKTLNALRQLDVERKRNIILFLYESSLIKRNSNLEVNIAEADLRDVKFIDSSAFSCTFALLAFRNVLADNITFNLCKLDDVVFDGSTMNDGQFFNSNLFRASFVGAHLIGATFADSNFKSANFTNANLRYSKFFNKPFWKVDLTNADLLGSDISNDQLIHNQDPNILLNTRFSNGSFGDIDASNLVINNGAELSVSSVTEESHR